MACMFCEIVARRAPSLIVMENAAAIAFLPLDMEVRGHTLLLPKRHVETLPQATDEDLLPLFDLSNSIAARYAERLAMNGFNLLLASGRAAQQSVPHLHFHFMPRFDGDGLDTWPRLPPFDGDREEFFRSVT